MSHLGNYQSTALKSLRSKVITTQPAKWKEFEFIQADDFKEWTEDAKKKLRASVLENNFTQPFYAWFDQEGAAIYCLDGYHRIQILHDLIREGYDIPDELPTTLIDCADKAEAARLVLIYSSIYAKITQQGLFDFIKMYDLELDKLKEQIDIPNFSMDRFDQKFDTFRVKNDSDEYEVDIDETIIVKPNDLFQLGNHRVYCESFLTPGLLADLMEKEKARILITDPPYNLPADFFLKDNKKVNNHKDFAMGSGEMTDEEFALFLESIMSHAKEFSVPGAIHYIFMDWRHVWHMTEASRRVYGSVIPKQICVWKKDLMANGSFYRAHQELCFVFESPGAKYLWNKDFLDEGGFYKQNDELCFIFKNGEGAPHLSHLDLMDRIRSNVWSYPSATSLKNPDRYELKNHPTPKPVSMIADAILDTTNPGDLVIDFFLGSGTALISCEKTSRRCYGTEIEPKYVQSIIKRYIHYCSKNDQTIIFKHLNGSLTLNDFANEKNARSEKDY